MLKNHNRIVGLSISSYSLKLSDRKPIHDRIIEVQFLLLTNAAPQISKAAHQTVPLMARATFKTK